MDKLINIISENVSIDVVGYVILYPFIALWIWSILYTTKDISHRTENIFYQILSIIVVTIGTPLVGFPLYFILRPYRTLDDIFWRKHVESFGKECLECGEINNKDNKFCTSCGDKLDIECKECKKEYNQTNDYCPYCGAPNLESN